MTMTTMFSLIMLTLTISSISLILGMISWYYDTTHMRLTKKYLEYIMEEMKDLQRMKSQIDMLHSDTLHQWKVVDNFTHDLHREMEKTREEIDKMKAIFNERTEMLMNELENNYLIDLEN